MGNPIIFQALLVLVILFFLFVTFMCFKTWKWFHPLLMLCVFGASICLAGYWAPVVKTHNAWKEKHAELEQELEKEQDEYSRVKYGDPNLVNQVEPPDPDAPLLTTRAVLQRLTLDRGTVWRECLVTGVQGPQAQLSTVPDDKPNHIAVNDILYAFAEAELDGRKIPAAYVGEMKVTNATDNTVTLSPTRRALFDNKQLQLFNQSVNQTWSLYSVMPIDGHEFFASAPPEGNYKLPIFGPMDEAALQRLLPPELADTFIRDGQKAQEDDPPENVWTKVEFTKPYKDKVDSENVRDLDTLFYFDPTTGAAEAGYLKIGDEASFKAGDFAILDTAFAQNLEDQGIVTKVDFVYIRELVDFDYSFKNHYRRKALLQESIRVIEDETTRLNEAIAKVEDMTTIRQEERTKLEEDKKKFVKERDEITSYAAELQGVWDARRKEMAALFSANLRLERELQRLNATLATQINRRTIEATAQVP